MNEEEIGSVMNKFPNIPFLGTFPSDEHCLPKILNYPACFISNLDPHWEKGSHWCAIIIINEENAEYFDSFGLPPLIESHIKLLNRYNYVYSTKKLQSFKSETCGLYAVLFLIMRTVYSMEQFLNLFTQDSFINDYFVLKLFSSRELNLNF